MADFTLNVSGMTCSACADAVTKAVQNIAPEAKVAVDLSAGTVRVENVPARAPVEAAIIRAGYEVAA